MVVNQLLVLPTEETLYYLSKVFSACPFDLDLQKCYVEINSSVEEMVPDPHRLYKAECGTMNVFFDSATMESSLLLPLKSPSLVDRCVEVRADAPSAFYGSDETAEQYYFPYMVVKRSMSPLVRHYRSFVNSISNVLATTPEYPLLFEGEFVVSTDFDNIPDYDYYASQLANVARR